MIKWCDSKIEPVDKMYKLLLERLIETILRKHDCGCMEICRCGDTLREKMEVIEEEARVIQDSLRLKELV